jgi:hypothetical protein
MVTSAHLHDQNLPHLHLRELPDALQPLGSTLPHHRAIRLGLKAVHRGKALALHFPWAQRAHGSLTCLHRLKLAAFWAIREFQRFQAVLQKFFQIFPPKSWVETHADVSGRWMRIFRAGSPVFLPLTDKWVLIKKVILEPASY